MLSRLSIVVGLVSCAFGFAVAAPAAAQPSRDQLGPGSPASGATRSPVVVRAERPVNSVRPVKIIQVEARAAGPRTPGASPAYDLLRANAPALDVSRQTTSTQIYAYDDDSFEDSFFLEDNSTGEYFHEVELAQRYTLDQAGTVLYAEVCLHRTPEDTSSGFAFRLNVFQNHDDGTGDLLGAYDVDGVIDEADAVACVRVEGDLVGLGVAAGDIWIGVAWESGTPTANTKLMALDTDSSGGARAYRVRDDGFDWSDWQDDNEPGVYGIRMAVAHAEDEAGYTDCVPETAALSFDGHEVRLCFETYRGDVGEARSGIWASGQAGLLWFFQPDNAEVLVKVLNGCAFNQHRWIFVAAVTDVAFNLEITSPDGEVWRHRNPQGMTALPAQDNTAFPCN